MTPRRSLSSNAKPTCVRSADTSHGGSYSNASKCRSPTCRLYLYQSTNFGTGALRPQNVGKSCREAAQQTDRPQRKNSSSEDCGLDNGGREGPQQTGGSCGTDSSREPCKACRPRADI